MKLEELDGLALGELVNSGELSPIESIKYFADRIEKLNPSINAFTYTKIDEALEVAKTQEKKILNNEYVGPFAGVPVALKDFLPSKKGWTNSHGGVKHLLATDDYDSEFCKAAESLGAIPIGKTNAPAFGFSGACQNALYGQTKNPFDINYTSGGSSGGTAAATAGGLIAFGEGGDAGGSIRIPSGWCNLFGFKPSLGTVPSYCRPDGWSATHPYCFNGALTKSVRDSATMLNAMAYYNPRDPISLPINSSKDFIQLMHKPTTNMKIAFTYDFDLYPQIDAEVKNITGDVINKLKDTGINIDFVSFKWDFDLETIMKCWAWSISVDTALDLFRWKSEGLDLVKDYRDELPEEFIHYNKVAEKASIHDMLAFNKIRTNILDNFEDTFENYDLIISPTAICPPLKNEWEGHCLEVNGIKQPESVDFIAFGETPLANFVGYPSASIPAGLTTNNLPVGIQVIGKQYKDEDVFALARKLEEIAPWSNYYKLSM